MQVLRAALTFAGCILWVVAVQTWEPQDLRRALAQTDKMPYTTTPYPMPPQSGVIQGGVLTVPAITCTGNCEYVPPGTLIKVEPMTIEEVQSLAAADRVVAEAEGKLRQAKMEVARAHNIVCNPYLSFEALWSPCYSFDGRFILQRQEMNNVINVGTVTW